MKNNLRLFCMGLAATAMLTAAAQVEDMTSRLSNPDMELGIKHWNVGGDAVFGKVEKSQSSRPAYYGFHGKALENWNGGGAGLDDNYISQTVRNLPSGTYVFGAYIAATFQEDNEVSNRDVVAGVSLFANEASVSVATDNPDKSEYKWAHAGKFNVAVTLPEAGNLRVGIKTESTTANFIIWDNASLYYFGNMSESEALNEMAKIDMAATIAIADTCLKHKMHVDSLASLNEQIAIAQTVATADALWQADEDLYWAIRLANKSIGDYRRFNDVLLHAERVLAAEWSENVAEQYTALQAMSAEYKDLYDAATLVRDEVAEKVDLLGEAIAKVELDSLYIVFDEVDEFIDNLKEEGLVGEDPGMLSLALLATLESLREEAAFALDAAMEGEKSAVEAAEYIAKLHNAMQAILDNPNAVDTFPIVLTTADGLPGTEVSGQNTWESRLYTFGAPLSKVRFTVLDSNTGDTDGGGNKCFALAEFFMKDANGEQIDLYESMVATNACHNTLNGPDGQGVPGMLDGNNGTYFHSSWGASAGGAHYLEVTLPEGEYTSFSFGFVSRNWRTTPTHIEVNVISEWRNELMNELSLTKNLHAYHGSDPGFYTTDLTSLYEAIAHAEAVLADENASDEDMVNAINALEQARELITEDMEIIYPKGGKTYRIVSANPAFYEKQGVHKALTINNDVLWWETFAKERQEQEFILEPIPSDDDAHYYEIKNVKSNRWIGRFENNNKLVLADEPDTIEVVPLGGGQFNLKSYGSTFHCNWHGGGSGTSEGICVWSGGFATPSSWYILEVVELPLTRLVENATCYETVHLFDGAASITLTADKPCAFDGLTIYDYLGYKIDAEISIIGNSASFVMDDVYNSFAFKFNNLEGVTSIEISSGGMTSLIALQRAYDEAVNVNPEEGKHVMQYADLSEYRAALAVAESLLASGGTDEQIAAAVAQLKKAVDNLVPNMPDPDKTYFIISALEAYEENHDVPMMMYANESELRWTYENTEEQNRYWKFEAAPAEEGAETSYYILNVGIGRYVGDTPHMVAQSAAMSYTIAPLGGMQVAIAPLGRSKDRFHTNNHWSGTGKGSNIVFWNDGFGTASAWKICETESYLTDIDFTQIEEENDAAVAPVVKGIYDLFGRRVANPVSGIYIIDGKKKLIK